jgi:hypothetical protein
MIVGITRKIIIPAITLKMLPTNIPRMILQITPTKSMAKSPELTYIAFIFKVF